MHCLRWTVCGPHTRADTAPGADTGTSDTTDRVPVRTPRQTALVVVGRYAPRTAQCAQAKAYQAPRHAISPPLLRFPSASMFMYSSDAITVLIIGAAERGTAALNMYIYVYIFVWTNKMRIKKPVWRARLPNTDADMIGVRRVYIHGDTCRSAIGWRQSNPRRRVSAPTSTLHMLSSVPRCRAVPCRACHSCCASGWRAVFYRVTRPNGPACKDHVPCAPWRVQRARRSGTGGVWGYGCGCGRTTQAAAAAIALSRNGGLGGDSGDTGAHARVRSTHTVGTCGRRVMGVGRGMPSSRHPPTACGVPETGLVGDPPWARIQTRAETWTGPGWPGWDDGGMEPG